MIEERKERSDFDGRRSSLKMMSSRKSEADDEYVTKMKEDHRKFMHRLTVMDKKEMQMLGRPRISVVHLEDSKNIRESLITPEKIRHKMTIYPAI